MIAFGAMNRKEDILYGIGFEDDISEAKERRDNDRFEVVFQFASNVIIVVKRCD